MGKNTEILQGNLIAQIVLYGKVTSLFERVLLAMVIGVEFQKKKPSSCSSKLGWGMSQSRDSGIKCKSYYIIMTDLLILWSATLIW